jgi:tight adherence protein B
MFVKKKQEKNQAIFNANLVKALRRMASNLRAGGTLKQAIMDVGKSNSMPIATRTEFINVLSDMEYGASVEAAFYKLYDRTGADDVRTLAVTIEIQRRTGGNLAEAFDNLAKVINKRELQEADIKATLAQAKSSAKLVSFMPFGLTFLLQIIQPNYFDAFYAWGDGLGKIIAFMIYGVICFGILLIDKMSSIKS